MLSHIELAQILDRAQKGDQQSITQLCRELETAVRGYFTKKFGSKQVVDDLCQETYLRLLESLPNIREPLKLRGFAVKVAVHVMHDYFRRKYRRQEASMEEPSSVAQSSSEETLEWSEPIPMGDRVLDRIELDRALAQLSEKGRQILLMKADGYKYEEIAQELDLSVSGVKMQVKRNIEKLRILVTTVTFWLISTTL